MSPLRLSVVVLASLLAVPVGARLTVPLLAQGALAPLGLTEARARTFLFDELKSEGSVHRRSAIAVAGHRAFYTLPTSARGPAAAALFAWARGYVSSPDFKAAYAKYRQEANPVDTRPTKSVDEQLAAQLAEGLASLEAFRKAAESLPPADRDRMLTQLKQQEAQIRDPAWAASLRNALELEQRGRADSNSESGRKFEERFPADPNRLVARRLRVFLDETADADFSARIIRLTDGPDGMEFIEPAHRAKPSVWQLAVLAGPEATNAARAAAAAWLKELEP